ncbi:MAG: AAA family ATPase [Pseudomonadales bacterium]|nr:AAA family ATPase [Pseudomonadales bacterium]MCP5182528.1 AAA family ATPase [Pseudomonadales bacterium]
MTDSMDRPVWLTQLLRPQAYPHACRDVRLVETHISWLLLTGDYVYKLRRPVNFGFVDFSTAERRQRDCYEEVRLNRHFTPELYVGVVPVVRDAAGSIRVDVSGSPQGGGDLEVVEWAVRMHQFDPVHLVDTLLAGGRLNEAHFRRFGSELATQHEALPRREASARDAAQAMLAPALDNFRVLGERCSPALAPRLHRLREATQAAHAAIARLARERLAAGFVRECHGDLHVGNLVLLDGRIRAFDCLEFNPGLRWIDTLSDVAFLVMDLVARGQQALAYTFLDGYMDACGDYDGLRMLNFLAAYRAMVRAKVAALGGNGGEPEQAGELARYLDEADRWLQGGRGELLICCGLSGSGKSFVAGQLVARLPALRLRSDVLRKTMAGLSPDARGAAIYGSNMTANVYDRLSALADALVAQGHCVILDATFLRADPRLQARAMAQARGVPLHVLYCTAPLPVLRDRIRARQTGNTDPSDADLAVLDAQIQSFEAPDEADTVRVDTSRADAVDAVLRTLRPS